MEVESEYRQAGDITLNRYRVSERWIAPLVLLV